MRGVLTGVELSDTHSLATAFESLSMACIIQRGGWKCTEPDPDRGADILCRDIVQQRNLAVEVKAARVRETGGQPRSAARNGRRVYQFRFDPNQVRDFGHAPNRVYIVWLVLEGAEPLALLFSTPQLRELCNVEGRGVQWNIHLFQSLEDPHDILWDTVNEETEGRAIRGNVEDWSCFTPHPEFLGSRDIQLQALHVTKYNLILTGNLSVGIIPMEDSTPGDLSIIRTDNLSLQNAMVLSETRMKKPRFWQFGDSRVWKEAASRDSEIFAFRYTKKQLASIDSGANDLLIIMWLVISGELMFPAVYPGDSVIRDILHNQGGRILFLCRVEDGEVQSLEIIDGNSSIDASPSLWNFSILGDEDGEGPE